jgi:hypothetical protein
MAPVPRVDLAETAGTVLSVVGISLFALGAALALGNKSGFLPTFPFAGLLTGAVGMICVSLGRWLNPYFW